jgi:hypothetical protein
VAQIIINHVATGLSEVPAEPILREITIEYTRRSLILLLFIPALRCLRAELVEPSRAWHRVVCC